MCRANLLGLTEPVRATRLRHRATLRHLEKPHVKFFLRVLALEQFCFPGRTYVECY